VFAERVGWLADLVRGMADQVIAAHWSDTDLAVLADGVGGDGRRLPASGWMCGAAARLECGGGGGTLAGVGPPVRRIAEEKPPALCGWDVTVVSRWLPRCWRRGQQRDPVRPDW
jgi:hypothetical protein